MSLAEQVAARRTLQEKLNAPKQEKIQERQKSDNGEAGGKEGKVEVEGYKMEKMKSQDTSTEVSSSGVQWFAELAILCFLALAVYGARRSANMR